MEILLHVCTDVVFVIVHFLTYTTLNNLHTKFIILGHMYARIDSTHTI